MKLNKIFMALAAVAMVGCSSEDVMDFSANQAPEDSRMIQLDDNFVLAGVVEEDDVTRTHWEMVNKSLVNKFLPIYAQNYDVDPGKKLSAAADLEAQAVGLCWLGQGAVGTDVYTNYQFYHFGWLNNDEEEADVNCDELVNGSLYSDITMKAGAAGAEAVPGTDWDAATGLLAKSKTAGGEDNLNYNSGVYKTDNKAIFGGQYIVYYPFDADFKNAGTIPAKAETSFNPVSENFNTKELGHATFRYSAPVDIEGGAQAAGFGMKNLSTLVQLRVACPAGDPAIGVKSIDQIILYSPSRKLLKQANLAADKIAAGQKGEALYAETEGTKTIVATFDAPEPLKVTTADDVVSAYITVLPTTVDDLKVLVHNSTDGTWATIDMPTTAFEAGKAKRLDITVTTADFVANYTAVDEASLTQALTEARLVAVDEEHATTIQVIGDITLATTPYNINDANDQFITITGDDIIVPEAVTLNLNTNMESDIRVLGKACCGVAATGGRLTIAGGTVGNVTMEETEARVTPATYLDYNPLVTYTGAATVAAGSTFTVEAGNVVVNSAVEHKGDIVINEGATVTVNGTGDLQFMGSNVTNDGTIEVMKAGHFDMTDANGNATAADGKRMTNNGTFIHNVDAAVGTAVQSMNQNGEYRCRVDDQPKLDDAFLQWTACNVIEMVNDVAKSYNLKNACKHADDYIDIEVSATADVLTTFSNPATADTKNIEIGSLTANTKLDITFVADKRTLTVHRDMNVYANTDLTSSKKIDVKGDLNVEGAGVTLTYQGAKANKDGLAVAGAITIDAAVFDAGKDDADSDVDALNITCKNFTLTNAAKAYFGNRKDGDTVNMTVSETIDNQEGCEFNIHAANQDGDGSVIARITCKTLLVGGTFPGGRPIVK